MTDERYQYVGVLSAFDLLHVDIKRASLIFDKIAIPNIASETSEFNKLIRHHDPDIDILLNQGIVIDPVQEYIGVEAYHKAIGADTLPQLIKAAETQQLALDKNLQHALANPINPASDSLIDHFLARFATEVNIFGARTAQKLQVPLTKAALHGRTFAQRFDYDRRQLVEDLVDRYHVPAFPLYVDDESFYKDYKGGQSDVLQIALHAIPEPVFDAVPWDKVLSFRNDPDTVRKRLAFRRWINSIASKDLKPIEIHDELEELCARYKEHIHLHGLKAQTHTRKTWVRVVNSIGLAVSAGVVAGIATAGSPVAIGAAGILGGAIGDLVTWLSDKGTDALFSLTEERIDLKLEEAKAPGREVAYIACIRDGLSQ